MKRGINIIIGIVGAGIMGAGVAQCCLNFSQKVIMMDSDEKKGDVAVNTIYNDLRCQILNKKMSYNQPVDNLMEKIYFTTRIEHLEDADYVIENVTEKLSIKESVYIELEKICKHGCVFIANTSAISITRLASNLKDPSRMIGIHFMNPVSMKSTVELIRGYHTSHSTEKSAISLLEKMQKKYVKVNDSPGFISNRVLMPLINEAVYLIFEQVASADNIDRVFKECFGHVMGPLETADLIGLDTVLFSMEVLYSSYNDCKYRPCPLLKKMVDAGLHGRKSGQGFFKYTV